MARRRASFWQATHAAWRESGLSQAEFCRQRSLVVNTFRWWRHRFRRATRAAAGAARPAGFVEYRIVKPAAEPRLTACGVEVLLRNGRRIRVERGFDAETLVQTAIAMES